MNLTDIPIIGLEIHVELATKSKMFCGCRNDPFGAKKPNIYTCPVCLGLPGALPVPNKKAIDWTVMLGLALACRINPESRFDRKHYFYPDLPKGYQISQYDRPFCHTGKIQISNEKLQINDKTQNSNTKLIGIRRVHLEEDTGKMLHRKISGKEVSLIDFNRSGVPLVEIVTEPDIGSAGEAKAAAKKIRQMVRFLGISDADMEKGSMRLEANVSLYQLEERSRKSKAIGNRESRISKLPDYKVELKNINSFRFMEKAINEEIERQKGKLGKGEKIKQETRGWDSKMMATKPQRTKETAADYRYFPEPDIPPIRLSDRRISEIRNRIPKMPGEILEELVKAGAGKTTAEVIVGDRVLARKALSALEFCQGLSLSNKDNFFRSFTKWLVHHQQSGKEKKAEELVKLFKKSREMVSDEPQLKIWVKEVMLKNRKAVADYRSGKTQAERFLIGQVQKLSSGKANIEVVRKLLLVELGAN